MEAIDTLRAKVEELKKALPCISFGYLGNYEFGKDYTTWYIFLPHYGRVGKYSDSVYIGEGRDAEKFTKALANWDKLEQKCRAQYAADPNRIGLAKLNPIGVLVEVGTGVQVSLGINPPPKFESVEAADEYLKHYNTPCVVVR
jgi:hypothetical protein